MNTEPHEITRYFATAFQVISKYDLLLSSHIGFFTILLLSVSNLFMICFPYAISNLNYIHLYSDKEVFGLKYTIKLPLILKEFSLSMFIFFTSNGSSFDFSHSTALHTSGDELRSVMLSIGIHLAPDESCSSNCSGTSNSPPHLSTP